MFAERAKECMALLGASTSDISRSAECDASNFSRLVNGMRAPRHGGVASRRFARGLYLYADAHNRMQALCDLVGCPVNDSAEHIQRRLTYWLFGDASEADNEAPRKPRKPAPQFRSFGEKLDAVMKLSELSNIRLGKLVSLDSSYISRFRNGFRSPRSNPQVAETLCRVLFERVCELGRLEKLCELCGGHMSEENRDSAYALFCDWLCDYDSEDTGLMVERLLDRIDSFPPEKPADGPLALPEAEEILADTRTVYRGTDGIRAAVVRFLSAALESGTKALWLFSDQNMDWMTGDEDFLEKWTTLMSACVQSGIRIRIVHNLDRGPGEMMDAIINWLPLYMSGMIESYSCDKQRDTRFSHTLFLCPGVACIEGFHLAGQEYNGIYRYHTDPDTIGMYGQMFSGLLSGSHRLVRIIDNASADASIFKQGVHGMTVLGTALSLATMPEETLERVMARGSIPAPDRAAIRTAQRERRELMMSSLADSYVQECIPVADDEALFAEEVPIDLPVAAMNYTPSEYGEHIRQILSLSDHYAAYRFVALPQAPFAHTQILITADTVAVRRLRAPFVTFVISHPVLCRSFFTYANRMITQFRQDKLALHHELERYL